MRTFEALGCASSTSVSESMALEAASVSAELDCVLCSVDVEFEADSAIFDAFSLRCR